jgi:hypothetical protein
LSIRPPYGSTLKDVQSAIAAAGPPVLDRPAGLHKGQQACPIPPQNDRNPLGRQDDLELSGSEGESGRTGYPAKLQANVRKRTKTLVRRGVTILIKLITFQIILFETISCGVLLDENLGEKNRQH